MRKVASMYSRDPGRIFREAGGSMEVTDECSNTGEIMSIESLGDRAPFCWNGGMVLWVEGRSARSWHRRVISNNRGL